MTLNFFDHFMSPSMLGVPLAAVAMAFPVTFLELSSTRWVNNRPLTLLTLAVANFTQLLSPLNRTGHKWAAVFLSLFLFLSISNMLGLLPFIFTPATQLSFSLGLAVPFWLATVILGARNHPSATLSHFLPEGTPPALVPALVIIETVSLLIRPVALGVRLTANLTAGHLLIGLISATSYTLLCSMPVTAMLTTTLLTLLTLLEVAVALIQAYVFVLLLTLYLQENTH